MRVVGLTGGIASGKSTVGRMLSAKGVAVIDADQVARQVLAAGAPALHALVDALGPHILTPTGELDRGQMRAAMSTDPAVKKILDDISHPAIRQAIAGELAALAAAGAKVAVVEAALLVETGGYAMYPDLVVVSCQPATQLQRLMARDGMTEAGARALVATQLPLADKEAVASVVVRNDGDAAQLQVSVDSMWEQLLG